MIFKKKKFRVRPGPTQAPTHFNSNLGFFFFAQPLNPGFLGILDATLCIVLYIPQTCRNTSTNTRTRGIEQTAVVIGAAKHVYAAGRPHVDVDHTLPVSAVRLHQLSTLRHRVSF